MWPQELRNLGAISTICVVFLETIVFFVSKRNENKMGRFSGESFQVPRPLAWFIMEFFSFFIPFCTLLICVRRDGALRTTEFVGLSCFVVHYTARVFCDPIIQAVRIPNSRIPLQTAAFALYYTSVNGFLQGYDAFEAVRRANDDDWFYWPRLILGITLFGFGFVGNRFFDGQLRTLKTSSSFDYVLPSRFFLLHTHTHVHTYPRVQDTKEMNRFNVVAPNYVCECVAMLGYVVLCRFAMGPCLWLYVMFALVVVVVFYTLTRADFKRSSRWGFVRTITIDFIRKNSGNNTLR